LWYSDTPSRTAWDEDDLPSGKKTSGTPFTPSYRYNDWADDRKRSGATPLNRAIKNENDEDTAQFSTEDERRDWENEQKQLDRDWYDMDEGNDNEQNWFNNEQYTKKREVCRIR
jgi:pre-mRNA-splicing factor ATP-dependent RNA helicase DHX38/PRP16